MKKLKIFISSVQSEFAKERQTHIIAEPMYLTAFIERLGTGTTDMVEKAKEAGLPEPEFVQNDMFRTVIYRKLLQPESRPELQPESRPELLLELRLESKLAAKVILMLRKTELKKSQIAKELGHKGISGELKKQIKRLIEQNLIEMTIPEKPNSRLQKYRLTPKALDLLNKLIIKKN